MLGFISFRYPSVFELDFVPWPINNRDILYRVSHISFTIFQHRGKLSYPLQGYCPQRQAIRKVFSQSSSQLSVYIYLVHLPTQFLRPHKPLKVRHPPKCVGAVVLLPVAGVPSPKSRVPIPGSQVPSLDAVDIVSNKVAHLSNMSWLCFRLLLPSSFFVCSVFVFHLSTAIFPSELTRCWTTPWVYCT